MSDIDTSRLILDAAGKPIGEYPKGVDPETPTRLHPVPKLDAEGNEQTDGDGNVITELVPLTFARAQEAIAAEGLRPDDDNPNVLVAADDE